MQEASNIDFAFFWKTKQVLCSLYRLPCRICGEIQAACTGQISVLGKSPISSWRHPAPSGGHARMQTWAESHVGQVQIEEMQTHSQAPETWDQTSQDTTQACSGCTGGPESRKVKSDAEMRQVSLGMNVAAREGSSCQCLQPQQPSPTTRWAANSAAVKENLCCSCSGFGSCS